MLTKKEVKKMNKTGKEIGKDEENFPLSLSAHLTVRTLRHPSLILPPSLSLHHSLSGGG